MEQKFYKITNEKEIHYGFQYQDGLNVDVLPFSETGCCVSGGLYFTTSKHIHKFFKYGQYVREIFLPLENPDFKMVGDPCEDKWRANMLILGKKYPLNHVQLYYKLCNDFEKAINLYELENNFCEFIIKHHIRLSNSKIHNLIFETPEKVNRDAVIILKNFLTLKMIEIDVTNLIRNNKFSDINFLQKNEIKIVHQITVEEYKQLPSYIICCMITLNLYQSVFNIK